MLKTRIRTFDRELDVLIDETLSPEAYSREFGIAARKLIEQQDAENDAAAGVDVRYRTFVDGRASGALETAKTKIRAEWDLLEPMFRQTLELLRDGSPALKGEYRDSITLFADGVPTAIGPDMPQAEEYFFAATVPYARKIERGLSKQAPNGVFEAVAALVSKRFGNVAIVRFGFRSLRGGAVGEWASRAQVKSHSNSRNRGGQRRTDWLTRQPAIVIKAR